ncbi:putative phosphomannomutase [Rosa chinensis]|uniref:Phosphomannomutase n=1 Tax=Rosa chinensis TaxID=74649 RepID=A0A2P6QDS2_ROSCH|nr:putative phosphomannomutase [Rosa chinensis]
MAENQGNKIYGSDIPNLNKVCIVNVKTFSQRKKNKKQVDTLLAKINISMIQSYSDFFSFILRKCDDLWPIEGHEFINFTLHYIADLDIPIKSQEERDEFERYDKVHNVRLKMVSILREKFAHFNLTFSIGGQISFDVSDLIFIYAW